MLKSSSRIGIKFLQNGTYSRVTEIPRLLMNKSKGIGEDY